MNSDIPWIILCGFYSGLTMSNIFCRNHFKEALLLSLHPVCLLVGTPFEMPSENPAQPILQQDGQ